MNITIRHENENDYRVVEELIRDCFYNLYFPGCNEHLSAHQIRKSSDFIPELTYVLEIDSKVMGCIFYSKSKVVDKSDVSHETISFGPVCIHPSLHRMGLGKKLITHSIEEAKKLGYGAILTLGYPYHYEPYGFVGGKKFGISMDDGKFYKGLLALELIKGYFDNISGYAAFTDALETTEEDLEAFDATFTYKEKKYQESQTEFENTVGLLDE